MKAGNDARAALESASEGDSLPPTDASVAAAATTGSSRTTEATKKAKSKTGKKKGKGAVPEDTHPCYHCQSKGAKMCCSQCHRAWYCGRPCQEKHWKHHTRACVAAVAAVAAEARQA